MRTKASGRVYRKCRSLAGNKHTGKRLGDWANVAPFLGVLAHC